MKDQLIDTGVHLHGTSYPMTDLYFASYDLLSSPSTTPFPVAAVLIHGMSPIGYSYYCVMPPFLLVPVLDS